jgi:hypothetical protein
MKLRERFSTWLGVQSWRLRRWLRPVLGLICKARGKHTGFYARGLWICRICSRQEKGVPPPGALIVDMEGRAIYQPHDGRLVRVDKFHGSKKDRRRNKAKVQALKRFHDRLIRDGEF